MNLSRSLLLCVLVGMLTACGDAPQAPAVPVNLPEPESQGAEVMRKHCASCHQPPAANTHPVEEWPNVVYRMSERLRLRGYPPMTAEEISVLAAYLQKHAKD